MPSESKDWTVADLAGLPDDGLQYELLDGVLLVTPATVLRHQRAAGHLYLLLTEACPPRGLEVYFAPVDWQPDDRTSLQPDLLVVRDEDVEHANIRAPLVLAVEILSPSTRRKDLILKRSKYEDVGVTSYWVVDPQAPSLTVFELREGRYVEVGQVFGSDELVVEQPFKVAVTPAGLVAR
jgi:Uma2 family endonuclease